MRDKELTDKYYKEAVKGLNETILHDKDLWYSYVLHLPSHLQLTYTIVIFHQQVFNGGLHQYFFNAYGQFAYMTLNNLKVIKAFKAAELLEEALNEVNYQQYSIDEFRKLVFNRKLDLISNFDDDLGDKLNILDEKYYSMDEDLEQLLVNYIKNLNLPQV